MQPGNGKLADAEIPVGMPSPLHVKIIAIVEGQRDACALELIDDSAVVDALDRNVTGPVAIEEPPPFPLQLRNIDGADAQSVLVYMEVGESLLRFGRCFQQDNILRRMVADDHAAQEPPVACVVMSAEKAVEICRQVEDARIVVEQHGLKAEDGRKGLQLH